MLSFACSLVASTTLPDTLQKTNTNPLTTVSRFVLSCSTSNIYLKTVFPRFVWHPQKRGHTGMTYWTWVPECYKIKQSIENLGHKVIVTAFLTFRKSDILCAFSGCINRLFLSKDRINHASFLKRDNQSITWSGSQDVPRSVSQTFSQLVSLPVSQKSVSQSTSQPVRPVRPVSQWVSQWVSRSVSQSVSQSVNKSLLKSFFGEL